MLFSSLLFLYLFLPLCLFFYYLSPRPVKNYTLLFASLIFFAWGGVSLTLLLIISIILNYCFGLLIQFYLQTRMGYWWLFIGVAGNLALLVTYKYADFLVGNLNVLAGSFDLPLLSQPNIALPIGISFYTFHSLSYLIDIYRGKTTAQKNIFHLALYICMFSQLIAGPIIRYSDVWKQLTERKHNWIKFSSGVERFLLGLARKVLLANTFARVADNMFNQDPTGMDALNAWLGIICYTLQIYHDFAGYSDMAIGLGRMFGFEFMENFNFPYISRSVKEFWRRWHISLSSFFRDYLYIPLGGNRVSNSRTYINLVIVFFLTGFWHGASWNFVVWGMFHGAFMVIENLGFSKLLEKCWQPLSVLYTLLVVMIAWILFRADTLEQAVLYTQALFNFNSSPEQVMTFVSYLNPEFILTLIIGILGSGRFFIIIAQYLNGLIMPGSRMRALLAGPYHIASALFYSGILILCTLYLVSGTYNPFIYYRF